MKTKRSNDDYCKTSVLASPRSHTHAMIGGPLSLLRPGHEPGWHQGRRRLYGLEADLLRVDAQRRQLALVDADGVVVALGALVHLVLQVLDLPVLRAEHLLQLLRDAGHDGGVELGGREHLRRGSKSVHMHIPMNCYQ